MLEIVASAVFKLTQYPVIRLLSISMFGTRKISGKTNFFPDGISLLFGKFGKGALALSVFQ